MGEENLTYSEMDSFLPGDEDGQHTVAATAEHFVCLVGPCRYYHDLLMIAAMSYDGQPQRDVDRRCLRFRGDGNDANSPGDYNLTEETVETCSAYAPPWWSLQGWKRKVANFEKRRDLLFKRKSPDVKLRPASLVLLVLCWLTGLFKRS